MNDTATSMRVALGKAANPQQRRAQRRARDRVALRHLDELRGVYLECLREVALEELMSDDRRAAV